MIFSYFFLLVAVLAIAAGWAVRRRLGARTRTGVTDDMMRQIETRGVVDAEDVDPLDLSRAQAEEDAFWTQTWDEPEEYG